MQNRPTKRKSSRTTFTKKSLESLLSQQQGNARSSTTRNNMPVATIIREISTFPDLLNFLAVHIDLAAVERKLFAFTHKTHPSLRNTLSARKDKK